MPRLTPEQRLEKARQAEAKARERAKRAAAEIAKKDRTLDARRKILLGAALLESATKSEGSARFIQSVIDRLERPHDRAAFEGWTVPRPPTKPEAS